MSKLNRIEVHVWHYKKPMISDMLSGCTTLPTEAQIKGAYSPVAEIVYAMGPRDIDRSLEDAFRNTQNIDKPWAEGQRSTSVGDLFLVKANDFGPDKFSVLAVNNIGFSFLGTLPIF